jgi:hypothetical protein
MLLEITLLSSSNALEFNIISSVLCFRDQHTVLPLRSTTRSTHVLLGLKLFDLRQVGHPVDGSWLVFISLRASMLLMIRLVLQQLFLAFLRSPSISSFCLDTFIVYTIWM